MIKVGISGAMGRMGRTIANLCLEDPDIKIVAAIEHSAHPDLNKDYGILLNRGHLNLELSSDLEKYIHDVDTIIDFSTPQNTIKLIELCVKHYKPIVIGTTGFNKDELEKIHHYATEIPILLSPNMSLGVNVLFYLVEQAAKLLKDNFEIEITEIHHSKKKDAPSGTAIQLKNLILKQLHLSEENIIYGRNGLVGERDKNQIGIHAIRGGDVVGEHTVFFFSEGERLEITHKATSRNIFARGAIIASKWIIKQPDGLYNMNNVLGLI